MLRSKGMAVSIAYRLSIAPYLMHFEQYSDNYAPFFFLFLIFQTRQDSHHITTRDVVVWNDDNHQQPPP
jgi:hypothetical protein